MQPPNSKESLNLSINEDVKLQMKIHCTATKQDVSTVTETLYREFLRSQGVRVAENPEESKPAAKKPVRYAKRKKK